MIDGFLNETEMRVVGSLVEKQTTTSDYYPLTRNAPVAACNQVSNRDPVISYDERTLAGTLDTLRSKNLVYVFHGADIRVPRYKHMLREALDLSPPQLAVRCVLMLRGPQTVGEIRGRTGCLHGFADLAEVEMTLDELARHDEGALVVKLSCQPGRKDSRYAHMLAWCPRRQRRSRSPRGIQSRAGAPGRTRAARGWFTSKQRSSHCAGKWMRCTTSSKSSKAVRVSLSKLPRSFYTRGDALEVARALLDKRLVVSVPTASASRVASLRCTSTLRIAHRTPTADDERRAPGRCTRRASSSTSTLSAACTTRLGS